MLRYSKHVRYLAELEKVPQPVQIWSEAIAAQLGEVLAGRIAPAKPPWLQPRKRL